MQSNTTEFSTLLRAPTEDTSTDQRDRTSVTYRKRCAARAQKQLADVYLLQGQYEQAAASYLTAQKLLRDLNEYLWLAGVSESYAVCLELQQREIGDPSASSDIAARYTEASNLYGRVREGSVPRVETHFKLAR